MDAGAIRIQANTLAVAGQTKIESDTRGSGNAGNIIIHVNTFNMLEDTDLSTSSFSSGNAGLIGIQADKINLRDQAFISSTTFLDSGDGGEVDIQASTSIKITEDATISTVTPRHPLYLPNQSMRMAATSILIPGWWCWVAAISEPIQRVQTAGA